MSNLKIKVKYGAFEIELDGDSETVKSEFNNIKENGLGNLLGKVEDFSQSTVVLPSQNMVQISNGDYPALKDIIMKQIPQSEAEWILIYAFYSTNYGSNYFRHSDIVTMYETSNRKTDSRLANLSNNIKTLFGRDYFSAVNDEEFMVTGVGKTAVTEILNRPANKSSNKSSHPAKKKKNSEVKKESSNSTSKIAKDFKLLTDLSFKPSGKMSLIEYAGSYQLSSYPEKIIIIINYLKETLKIDKVSSNHIFTGLREIKERIPTALDDILTKTKSRNGWIKYDSKDDISLSIKGAEFIIHDLKKKK